MKRRDVIRAVGAVAIGLTTFPSGAAQNNRQAGSEILIQGGTVVNADGSRLADVRIQGQRITEIGTTLTPSANSRIIEANDHLVIPGGIDPHTHLQGRFVDDLTTGTAAAVAGGALRA